MEAAALVISAEDVEMLPRAMLKWDVAGQV
jgi:hypothetical protein